MVRKIVSSLIVLIFLSATAVVGSNNKAQEPARETLDQRLGADDGAALAILFGANMRGNLEVCD